MEVHEKIALFQNKNNNSKRVGKRQFGFEIEYQEFSHSKYKNKVYE